MTITITEAATEDDLAGLHQMMREYLEWDIAQLNAVSGIDLDPEDYIANTFDEIDLFFPPMGRLLLARSEGRLVGMAFLKPVREGVCEIKRMYVRPEARGHRLGQRMLERLLAGARHAGYQTALLDSAVYMKKAHALYQSMGFRETEYYPEGETDQTLASFMVYMKLDL